MVLKKENEGLGVPGSANDSIYNALVSAYAVIFYVNLKNDTVQCLHGRRTGDMAEFLDMTLTVYSAKNFWLNNYIIEPDRAMMRKYIDYITTPGAIREAKRPLQTDFQVRWKDDETYSFIGVAVEYDEDSFLFCCRDTTAVRFSARKAREAAALEKLSNLVEGYIKKEKNALGIVCFEPKGDRISLIFASEAVRDFFSVGRKEYLRMLNEDCSVRDILKGSQITPHTFRALNETGIQHLRLRNKNDIPVDVCLSLKNEKETGKNYTSIYIYNDMPRAVPGIPKEGVFIRTFGQFDVFYNGLPVTFTSSKAKELMAILVDSYGGTVSMTRAIELLWGIDNPTENDKVRYRKLVMNLKKSLDAYGLADMIISSRSFRSLDVSKVTCDYYEMVSGNEQFAKSFHNAYMEQYSWAESSLSKLWDYS